MADKPILFSGPIVRALLAGTKTQTRRVVKPQPELQGNGHYHVFNAGGGVLNVEEFEVGKHAVDYLRISVGDRLYVREAFSGYWEFSGIPPKEWSKSEIWYWADGNPTFGDWTKPKPGMHMPRWASRLTLTVTDVRVERLKDIGTADAIAEGIELAGEGYAAPGMSWLNSPEAAYRCLWQKINGDDSWDENPWVAAYTFTVERGNIDNLASAA